MLLLPRLGRGKTARDRSDATQIVRAPGSQLRGAFVALLSARATSQNAHKCAGRQRSGRDGSQYSSGRKCGWLPIDRALAKSIQRFRPVTDPLLAKYE